jgi:hypothetical protein
MSDKEYYLGSLTKKQKLKDLEDFLKVNLDLYKEETKAILETAKKVILEDSDNYNRKHSTEICGEGECEELATYIRCTQFAGDHPYCTKHAKLEKDFKKEDPSYFFWQTIKAYNKKKEK